MENSNLSLHVGNDVIEPVSVVRDLDVLLDNELSMKKHVSKVASVYYFHLCRLKPIRRILGRQITTSLVNSFVSSRLDYCNSVLAELPKSTIAPLQRVQNAAVRLICGLGPRAHVSPALYELHWLPMEQRLTFKLCVFMYLIHTGPSPSYLSELVMSTSSIASRSRLRSANSRRYEPPAIRLKLGEQSFAFAGPVA
jgi:hypothetical protein